MTYPQYTQQTPPAQAEQPSGYGEQSAGNQPGSMTDQAAQAAEQGKQAVGEVAESATERAADVKDEAVRQARDLAGEARGQLAEHAGQQHRAVVSNLRSLSGELDRMSRSSGETGVASELANRAQQHTSSLADWLDSREPAQILDEVRDFARQRPGTFLLGALAAGVVAGRLARGAVQAHSGDDATAADGNGSITRPEPAPAATGQTAYSPPVYSPPPAPSYSAPPHDAPTQAYPGNGSWQ